MKTFFVTATRSVFCSAVLVMIAMPASAQLVIDPFPNKKQDSVVQEAAKVEAKDAQAQEEDMKKAVKKPKQVTQAKKSRTPLSILPFLNKKKTEEPRKDLRFVPVELSEDDSVDMPSQATLQSIVIQSADKPAIVRKRSAEIVQDVSTQSNAASTAPVPTALMTPLPVMRMDKQQATAPQQRVLPPSLQQRQSAVKSAAPPMKIITQVAPKPAPRLETQKKRPDFVPDARSKYFEIPVENSKVVANIDAVPVPSRKRSSSKSGEWVALKGALLEDTMRFWSQRSNTQLVWEGRNLGLKVLNNVSLKGSYEDAIEHALEQYANRYTRPEGSLYIDPKTKARTLLVKIAEGL